jgi:hypothetical protein
LDQGLTEKSSGPSRGHLPYVQARTLMAAPFDVQRLRVTGTPVVQAILQSQSTRASQYNIPPTESVVYISAGLQGRQSKMVWVGCNGVEQSLPAPPHNYEVPRKRLRTDDFPDAYYDVSSDDGQRFLMLKPTQ